MAGYNFFNWSDQPLWATTYNMPGEIIIDAGEIASYTWRSFESGYAFGSYYNDRGEWPMVGKTSDVWTGTHCLNKPLYPWTFVKDPASTQCWWTHPAWSVVNRLDRPIWITIYGSPGGIEILDSGQVDAYGQAFFYAQGSVTPNSLYRLRAESIPDGKDFDISVDPASFVGGFGIGTFSKSGTDYVWSINRDPRWSANDVIALPRSELVVQEPPKVTT
jgi:hypothetical protein